MMDRKILVSFQGIMQKVTFREVQENTPFGKVVFLIPKRRIPVKEMVRISEDFQIPVKFGEQIALPKGKMLKDFSVK